MDSLPTFLRLQGRKCLLVGDHTNTQTLIASVMRTGAQVTVIGNDAVPSDGVVTIQRNFNDTDLIDCWLVVSAFDDDARNRAVVSACEKKQIFCHVTGNPGQGTAIIDTLQTASASGRQFSSALTAEPLSTPPSTRVSLVGAGPGDPDLLTLRALRLIQSASVVVYDRLVSTSILSLCNPAAQFIYAGKAKANHALPQDSINELLVELAKTHDSVVRLKGGDPFIFGRGGEEIETLTDHKVSFQVVPGITAASGCAAFSGIPLTHRDHAQSCVFVTGHLRDGQINLNWKDLRDPTQTIVVYMGLTGLRSICETLIKHGRDPHTPAALVEQGTTTAQRVLASTLNELPQLVEQTDVGAPTLLIIGGVVSLREKLDWFGASQ